MYMVMAARTDGGVGSWLLKVELGVCIRQEVSMLHHL